jgi:hypothetical protein
VDCLPAAKLGGFSPASKKRKLGSRDRVGAVCMTRAATIRSAAREWRDGRDSFAPFKQLSCWFRFDRSVGEKGGSTDGN